MYHLQALCALSKQMHDAGQETYFCGARKSVAKTLHGADVSSKLRLHPTLSEVEDSLPVSA